MLSHVLLDRVKKARAPKRTELCSLPRPSGGRAGVLLIGDSLSKNIKPQFTSALTGQPTEVDADFGISIQEGMRRFRDAHADKPRVVEMALFTNNSPVEIALMRQALDETVADARARNGRVIWATLYRSDQDYSAVNDLIRSYAAVNCDVMGVVDWAAMVKATPSLIGPDGVHCTPEGDTARARAFAAAI